MVNCVVKNWQGEAVGEATLEMKVAKPENAEHIVHRALVRQANNSRQGTASTKTRAEVSGGGRKPWRQKGTGRARAGSNRSPLWRGGGVVFGPKPKDYNLKMNRKERRLALRTALMSRVDSLIVVDQLGEEQFPQPRTKDFIATLDRLGITSDEKVLLVLAEITENLYLSARNIATVKIIEATSLNIYDILVADKIVTTSEALAEIQEVYND